MEIYGFYNGEKKSLTQLAAESGVSYDTLLARYKAGVPFGELVDKPDGGSGVSVADVLEAVYPVGAIYMSAVDANPKTLFGFGTWERIYGRFLLATDSNYAIGSTGGNSSQTKSVSISGTTGGTAITIAQMPAHTHVVSNYASSVGWSGNSPSKSYLNNTNDGFTGSTNPTSKSTGGGQAHTHSFSGSTSLTLNNMPPYLAVHVWKRVS